MKQPVNSLCNCGSGIKFKKCCRNASQQVIYNTPWPKEWRPMINVSSKDSEPFGMTVYDMSVSEGTNTKIFVNDELTISTNKIQGDKANLSGATLSFPRTRVSSGEILTYGNASVSGSKSYLKISLPQNQKKLKTISPAGLFAIGRLGFQRTSGQHYIDILFGVAGKIETKDDQNDKDRPHLAFYPDGNGKFVRLSEFKCEIESIMDFDSTSGQIIPRTACIKILEYNQVLRLNFVLENGNHLILNEILFEET